MKRVVEDLMKQLDKKENESHPDALLDINQIDFGPVFYMKQYSRSITIQNTGPVLLLNTKVLQLLGICSLEIYSKTP